jgi:hypothetical protein
LYLIQFTSHRILLRPIYYSCIFTLVLQIDSSLRVFLSKCYVRFFFFFSCEVHVSPSLSSWFYYHPNNIWWRVQIVKHLICYTLYFPVTSFLERNEMYSVLERRIIDRREVDLSIFTMVVIHVVINN